MKLFLISAPTSGYDVYSRAVVAAETPKVAAKIHPDERNDELGYVGERVLKDIDYWEYSWVADPKEVSVEYLGLAKRGTKRGVICASFHAG